MKFKNYIETESGIKDTSTSPGTAGQVLSSTVAGTSWIDQSTLVSGSAERVSILVKNGEGTALVKGDPVYIIGSVGASATLEVGLCDASDSSKMPCVGLLEQDLLNNGQGTAVTAGKLRNLITTPIDGQTTTENDTIYVKAGGSSGLALTITKPTGSTNLIQNVGQVGRVSASADGNFVVSAIMRTNDVPNLPTGKIWVGDGNTIVSDTVYLDETNERMGIGTTTPSTDLEVSSTGVNGVDISQSASNASQSGRLFFTTNTASEGFALFNSNGTFQVNSGGIPNNTSGTNRISIIGSSGNVGIGTTSPAKKLTIGGIGIGNTDGLKIEDPSNTAYGAHYSYDDASSTVEIGGVTNNTLNDCISIARDATRTITINTSEFVGIGTTTPATKLQVFGTTSSMPALGAAPSAAQLGGSSFGTLFSTLTSGRGVIQQGRSDGTATSYDLLLQPVGGKVAIARTSATYTLDVTGEGRFTGDLRCLTLIQTSQRDQKENINDINKSKAKAIPFKEYTYKSSIDGSSKKTLWCNS